MPKNLVSAGAVFLIGNIWFATMASTIVNDVSSSVEEMGNPVNAAYPNAGLGCVQDLHLFNGKVFLGYGNINNRVPKIALYLDPTNRTFNTDSPGTLLNDEILHRFRVFGGEMYVESFDPIDLSNLYLRSTNGWSITTMNFPGTGRHDFDIFKFNNVLFTGGGFGFPGIAMSLDGGANWIVPGADITNVVFNDSEFFDFNGQFYVSQDLTLSEFYPGLAAPFLLKYTGSTNTPFTTLYSQPSDIYPAGDLNQGRLSHFEKLRDQGAFIGNGGVYVVSSMEPPVLTKATLPNGLGDCAVDLRSRGNGVYFLACSQQFANAEFPYLGVIGKSEDFQNWVEICRFGAREFVQSFEMVDGDFYVGLGNLLTTANPHSGDMLRIPELAANEERSVVIPASLEFTNGSTGSTYPFGLGQPVRYQQVYSSSEFSSLSGPQLITRIAFRPTVFGGQAFTNAVQNLRIDFSTTPASPETGLSTQFALNTGSNVSTVFTGAVVLASAFAGPGSGPEAFDVEIALQKPFFYDPAEGNLLMDIYNLSGSLCPLLDTTSGAGLPSARMVSSPGGVANATGTADASPTCLVTKFKLSPATQGNRAPTVFAGFAQTITLPQPALLNGMTLDDSLPNPPGTTTSMWSKVSGPGSVVFSNPQAPVTAATFSGSGIYLLGLTVGDGAFSVSSDVVITVLPIPLVNLAPVVDAGAGQTIPWTNRATASLNAAGLNGLVADDGYPQPPGLTTSLWVMVSGPGNVAFDAPSAPLTSARFSMPGSYVLRLIAGDGELSGSNDTPISVVDVPGVNQAPAVNAGPELTATQLEPVTLNGQVADDGLPSPPGAVAVQWTKVTGPGTVLFANSSNGTTTATFSLPGKYVVRLTASDGSLAGSAETTVHVLDGSFVVVPNNLSDANGLVGNGYPLNIADSLRYQQVYASSQFPSNTGSFLVTEIAFRPSATSGGPFTSSIPDLVIELSTTGVNPSPSLYTTFADNVGADKQPVFSGPITLSSKFLGPGPKEFDIIIPLQRAFLYDPRQGNLLLDIRNIAGSLTTYMDSTYGTGIPSSRVVSRTGGVDDAQGYTDASPTALVTRFTLCLPPAPQMSVGSETNPYAVRCESVFGQRLVVESSTNLVDWTLFQTYLPLYQAIDVESPSVMQSRRFYRSYIAP